MTDKVTLIMQEMQEKMNRALLIRVGSDEDATTVARKIVDTSTKAANDAINAYEKNTRQKAKLSTLMQNN